MTDPERVADPMPRTLPALDSPVLATVADAIERGADPVEAAHVALGREIAATDRRLQHLERQATAMQRAGTA